MKHILRIVILVAVIAVAVWYATSQQAVAPTVSVSPSPAVSESAAPNVSATPSPVTGVKTFTAAEVATHNSRTSCYSIVRGDVYDLTSFIDRHPGGAQKILNICGKDGTSLFEGQHGGSEKQETLIVTFKIGTLAQ